MTDCGFSLLVRGRMGKWKDEEMDGWTPNTVRAQFSSEERSSWAYFSSLLLPRTHLMMWGRFREGRKIALLPRRADRGRHRKPTPCTWWVFRHFFILLSFRLCLFPSMGAWTIALNLPAWGCGCGGRKWRSEGCGVSWGRRLPYEWIEKILAENEPEGWKSLPDSWEGWMSWVWETQRLNGRQKHLLRDGVARENSIPHKPREQKARLSLGRI